MQVMWNLRGTYSLSVGILGAMMLLAFAFLVRMRDDVDYRYGSLKKSETLVTIAIIYTGLGNMGPVHARPPGGQSHSAESFCRRIYDTSY